MLKIINMKVDTPSCIWGRVVHDDSSKQYKTLQLEMNLLYNNVDKDWHKLLPNAIDEGQVFVVYWSTIKSWCRAKVEAVIHGSVPVRARCFLVDYGERVSVPSDKIRIGLPKFLQLPFCVRRFHLARIKPMTLHVSPYEDKVELIPSFQWDSSATLYLHNLLQASTVTEAVLLENEHESTSIELFMTIDFFKICVNDDLVAKRFANYSRRIPDSCVLDKEDPTPLMLSSHILNQTLNKTMQKPPKPISLTSVASQSLPVTVNDNSAFHDDPTNRLLNISEEGNLANATKGYWPPMVQSNIYTSESDLSEDFSLPSVVTEKPSLIRFSGHQELGNTDQHPASIDDHKPSEHQPVKMIVNSTISKESDLDSSGPQESLAVEKPPNKESEVCQRFRLWLNQELFKTRTQEEKNLLFPVDLMKNEILVHSALPPLEPFTNLDEVHLTDPLCRELKRQRHPALSASESHSWPHLAQGSNTLVISSNGDDLLTYIPPILHHILLNSVYCSQTSSTGPIAVVLCPSWERVQMVYNLLQELNVSRVLNPVTVLLGHGKDEAKELRISKNCLLLVTTPFTLVRLLSCRCFLFLHVYHLILDEADELFMRAADQMSTVLQHFKKITSDEENADCPQQIVAMSKHWTHDMESLITNYMTNPSIIISSSEEAAFYGKVHQVVYMTLESNKTSILLGALDFHPDVGQKTLIITHSSEEVDDVFKAISRKSAFCLKLHEGLIKQIDEVLIHWRKEIGPGTHVVLVTTNECLKSLGIRDATCVAHYSFPTSPKLFGRRLFCMSDNFRNLSGVTQSDRFSHDIKSLLLISERNVRHVTGIVRYMKRTNVLLPPELQTFAEGIQVVQEEKKSSFCLALKSFGLCSNSSKCLDRHRFDSFLDGSELPASGIIEVLPLHVKTASVYFGRILNAKGEFEKMMSELACFYADNNIGVEEQVLGGGLYAVEENNVYHRVKVLSFPEQGNQLIFTVMAEFIDVGKKEELKSHQLLPLPLRFHSPPGQAVEIILCQMKPIDAETQWHPKVTRAVSQKIKGLQHRARAVFSLGNTVFVDCMVHVTKVPGLKTQINEYNVKSLIMETGMGEENPQHLDVLQALSQRGPDESINLSTTDHVYQGNFIDTEAEVLVRAFEDTQVNELTHLKNNLTDVESILESTDPALHCGHDLVPQEDNPPTTFPSNNHEAEVSVGERNQVPSLQKVVAPEPHVQLPITKEKNKDTPQSLHPQVRWFQTLESLIVTVRLIAPEKQQCGFYTDKVVYSGQVNGESYRAELQLQGSILADHCSWEMKSNEPVLKLVKLQRGHWNRLVQGKNIFVSYDLAHLEEDEEQEKKMTIVEKHNHRTEFSFFGETGEGIWYMTSDSVSDSD